MRKGVFVLAVLVAMVIGTVAWGFDAYFSDASGNKITQIQEGQKVYIAIKDPDKGACGIDEFQADLVIFDFKTGAYIEYKGAWFRESATGSALYFWVQDQGSSSKVDVPIGDRAGWGGTVGETPAGGVPNYTHILGDLSSAPTGVDWEEGAWMYVDENVLNGDPIPGTVPPTAVTTTISALPREKRTARVDFEGLTFTAGGNVTGTIEGRLENMDTLVLIVADQVDERNIDQDQLKIIDTQGKIDVSPSQLSYACGSSCQSIVVRIEDEDEDLDPTKVEYVPFFVIVNPGSWNPQTSSINDFCTLMKYGSVDSTGGDLDEPIRWYNIYSQPVVESGGVASRWIKYPAAWLDGTYTLGTPSFPVGRALFFAVETGPDTGVFEYTFGNLTELQQQLGFKRFTPGTTIAFYYVDPNDFDDMDLVTAVVGDRAHSETYITDAMGNPVDTVDLGGGIYLRVYDADANVNACCQDKVVVHLCDIHGEDDSEYVTIDEVSNDSGIFASTAAMPLQPVWDAVGGYQLVVDDWKFQAFNEDTIFARYNSVDYVQDDLNKLGDGDPNDGSFPPSINEAAPRNQVWDVSFAKVKVYDTQVFDGSTHYMRFLNGRYESVDEIPLSGNLYLEVTDPDQNENPLLSEMIASRWNKDAYTGDDGDRTDTSAIDSTAADTTQDANEDSAPIWWMGDHNPAGTSANADSDKMTPQGAVTNPSDVFLGAIDGDGDGDYNESITGIPETVKIFMWDAQRGTWEALDLKETAPNSGIFRSTTCVLVADERHPGDGNLGAKPGDTIMAFYQDPSNHSDVSIISIKVAEGGAAGVTPPTRVVKVEFNQDTYTAGDTVVITVTDDAYAGAGAISGTDVLVLTLDGTTLQSWNQIPAKSGTTDQFEVTYTLPEDVASGTLTVTYTQPFPGGKSVTDTAEVVPAALQNVTGISVSPNPFSTTVDFEIVAEPSGAKADKITVSIYDLLGRKVAEVSDTDTASVSWDGTDSSGVQLRNGAYIYVAVVEGAGKTWTFRGFVYIKR